jgi:hypothetical protein
MMHIMQIVLAHAPGACHAVPLQNVKGHPTHAPRNPPWILRWNVTLRKMTRACDSTDPGALAGDDAAAARLATDGAAITCPSPLTVRKDANAHSCY